MRLALALILILNSLQSYSCTTFVFNKDGKIVFGRNYDWHLGNGYIFENKRGINKTAFVFPPEIPAKWTSKYGSITFNQFGKEFPLGGMNEEGLVIEVLWLNSAEFPKSDGRPALNELQWVQYQLDNFSSVNEVIESDSIIRIGQSYSNIHYLVADHNGNVASIEFLNGKLVYHTGKDMPSKCLTNNSYDKSLEHLNSREKKAQASLINYQSDNSLDRFAQASDMISKTTELDPISQSFKILKQVEVLDYTKWSIVYDVSDEKIYFKSQDSKELKYLEFSAFNFHCDSTSEMIDINIQSEGNVTDLFKNYDEQENFKLIKNSISEMPFLEDLPEEFVISLAKYPAKLKCTE